MLIRPVVLAASMAFSTYAFQDGHEPKERRVQKQAAGVDFTYHSQVDKVADKKFTLNHSIKNNSSTPLSVEWKDAGIICIGTSQLPGGNTDWGSSGAITDSPALKEDSDIMYGVKLNYHTPAQIYIDPQRSTPTALFKKPNEETVETTYTRKNKDDEVVFSIRVISVMNHENHTAQLTFKVSGGLSVALATEAPRRPAGEILQGFTEPRVSEVGLGDKAIDRPLKDWFEVSSRGSESRLLVLNNSDPDEIEFTTTFADRQDILVLRKLHVIAFKPNEAGFIGLTALAYIPSELSLK